MSGAADPDMMAIKDSTALASSHRQSLGQGSNRKAPCNIIVATSHSMFTRHPQQSATSRSSHRQLAVQCTMLLQGYTCSA